MKKARFWIGILISIIALVFAFRQVDFAGVWAALTQANFWFLLASLVPLLLFLVLRAFRWRLLFYPQRGLRIRNLFAVINIGYLLSNIFPARLGDVARELYVVLLSSLVPIGLIAYIVALRKRLPDRGIALEAVAAAATDAEKPKIKAITRAAQQHFFRQFILPSFLKHDL